MCDAPHSALGVVFDNVGRRAAGVCAGAKGACFDDRGAGACDEPVEPNQRGRWGPPGQMNAQVTEVVCGTMTAPCGPPPPGPPPGPPCPGPPHPPPGGPHQHPPSSDVVAARAAIAAIFLMHFSFVF